MIIALPSWPAFSEWILPVSTSASFILAQASARALVLKVFERFTPLRRMIAWYLTAPGVFFEWDFTLRMVAITMRGSSEEPRLFAWLRYKDQGIVIDL